MSDYKSGHKPNLGWNPWFNRVMRLDLSDGAFITVCNMVRSDRFGMTVEIRDFATGIEIKKTDEFEIPGNDGANGPEDWVPALVEAERVAREYIANLKRLVASVPNGWTKN